MTRIDGKLLDNSFVQETPSGTINGSNKSFSITYVPTSASCLDLYQDGLLLLQATDYTISSQTITMTTAPALGQKLIASYIKK
jgi:hypothetical protein